MACWPAVRAPAWAAPGPFRPRAFFQLLTFFRPFASFRRYVRFLLRVPQGPRWPGAAARRARLYPGRSAAPPPAGQLPEPATAITAPGRRPAGDAVTDVSATEAGRVMVAMAVHRWDDEEILR